MPNWDDLANRARADDEAARAAADELVKGGSSALPAILRSVERGGPPGNLSRAVARIRDAAAFPIFADGLQVDSYDVVKLSAMSLGRSGDRRALAALLHLLADEKRSAVDRSLAAEALGDLGYPEAREPLHRCIEDKRPELEWEEWPVLLINSAVALAKLGDHTAVDAVLEALRSAAPSARSLAATALCIVTGPGVQAALSDALRDRSREVRRSAIDPIFLLGTVPSAEALVASAGDDVDDIAELALLRLGDLIGETLDEQDGEDEAREAWQRHRSDFPPGVCCRSGRPLRVAELAAELARNTHRRDDLCEELRILTGLPVADLVEERGVDALHERVRSMRFVDGGFYKWGRRMSVDL